MVSWNSRTLAEHWLWVFSWVSRMNDRPLKNHQVIRCLSLTTVKVKIIIGFWFHLQEHHRWHPGQLVEQLGKLCRNNPYLRPQSGICCPGATKSAAVRPIVLYTEGGASSLLLSFISCWASTFGKELLIMRILCCACGLSIRCQLSVRYNTIVWDIE